MEQKDIESIAMRQSAVDLGCDAEDFLSEQHRFVESAANNKARRYLELPFLLNMVSYGSNIVVSGRRDLLGTARNYISDVGDFVHCFETPGIRKLDRAMEAHHAGVCFMAEYFLPSLQALKGLDVSCPYPARLLGPAQFEALYIPQWSNALCADRKQLDILGLGAYDGDQLVGMAACSMDAEDMWQIGIDVLPAYRRQGVAQALTAGLAREILARDKVPFYCAAWSNIRSVRNAIASGFRPAWVEMTVKDLDFIKKMQKGKEGATA